VVLDPIGAYLNPADTSCDAHVRRVLARLAGVAARAGVAVLAVTHFRKSDGPAIYRTLGSLAFAAASRTLWVLCADPLDDRRRLLLLAKSNLTQLRAGLSFRARPAGPGGPPRVVWGGEPVDATADQALRSAADLDLPERRREAERWLAQRLRDGPAAVRELVREADAEGIRPRTLRRAKQRLRVLAVREGYGNWGRWTWTLPERRCRTPALRAALRDAEPATKKSCAAPAADDTAAAERGAPERSARWPSMDGDRAKTSAKRPSRPKAATPA
jgi:hypothetical protein